MKTPDIVIDRTEFMYWVEGYAIYRTKTRMVMPNDLQCGRADRVLKKGGTVMLTVKGKPFSTLKLDKKQNAFIEKEISRGT